VLPVDPCDGESDWACGTCGGVVQVQDVVHLVRATSAAIGKARQHGEIFAVDLTLRSLSHPVLTKYNSIPTGSTRNDEISNILKIWKKI
jgi:hypothetical protein